MRRIAYAQTVIGTDEHLADLLLEYATLLARSNSADTVVVPGRIGDGEVEAVSVLVGPASQMTAWNDAEPFAGDVTAAVADLEQRIAAVGSAKPSGPIGPGAIDEFDDLA